MPLHKKREKKDRHDPNLDLKRRENLLANSKCLAQPRNSSNNRDGGLLCLPRLYEARQLNQMRVCIYPAYLRGYKFPPHSLSLR